MESKSPTSSSQCVFECTACLHFLWIHVTRRGWDMNVYKTCTKSCFIYFFSQSLLATIRVGVWAASAKHLLRSPRSEWSEVTMERHAAKHTPVDSKGWRMARIKEAVIYARVVDCATVPHSRSAAPANYIRRKRTCENEKRPGKRLLLTGTNAFKTAAKEIRICDTYTDTGCRAYTIVFSVFVF